MINGQLPLLLERVGVRLFVKFILIRFALAGETLFELPEKIGTSADHATEGNALQNE